MTKRFFLVVFLLLLVLSISVPASAAANDEEMIVAYISAPDDWENPCVWAWDDDGKNAFAAWPGGAADADPANEGWYYIYLPVWANNYIVNASEGTVQTGDFKVEGNNLWITIENRG